MYFKNQCNVINKEMRCQFFFLKKKKIFRTKTKTKKKTISEENTKKINISNQEKGREKNHMTNYRNPDPIQ
jgi:hypothetical protein